MSQKQNATPTDSRVRLLTLLEEARPFAELMVYREGILPALAADDTDCIDGCLQAMSDWRDRHLSEDHRTILELVEGNLYDAAIEASEAGYVLGIAVGLLLRPPQKVEAADLPETTQAGAR